LFTAKQNEVGSVGMDSEDADVRVQVLGIHHLNCKEDECARILSLLEKLKNICFIQGSHSYKVQTVVGSRNSEIFSEIICDVSSFLRVQSVSQKARPLIYFSIYNRR
jgi:hypothetical protein